MSIIVNKANYDPQQAGSYYSIGAKSASIKIIFLHGSNSYAGDPEEEKRQHIYGAFAGMDVELICINGPNKSTIDDIPEEYREEASAQIGNRPLYTWFYENQAEEDHLSVLIDDLSKQNPSHIILLGFSQGGFKAFEQMMETPEKISGIILHSSGMVTRLSDDFEEKVSRLKTKPNVLTIMGTVDPFLDNPAIKAVLKVHEFNSAVLEAYGLNISMEDVDGLGHTISARSMDIAAAAIRDWTNAPQP